MNVRRDIPCDLCGARDAESVEVRSAGRVMFSDRRSVPGVLRKIVCRECGLIANGGAANEGALDYRHGYAQPLAAEHQFITPDGPVPRSAVFADWMTAGGLDGCWRRAGRILEVGVGNACLMERLIARYPHARFEGLELGLAAAERARTRGLEVRSAAPDDLERERYDLIYAVAVLEHVPSPSGFLGALAARLRPEGWLILAQPTQDVPSPDILFADHLHHFATPHLAAYARRAGMTEAQHAVGHPLMPNFSLHAWRRAGAPQAAAWCAPPAATTGVETLRRAMLDFARVDALLDEVDADQRRLAVFGVEEAYALAAAYSQLGDRPPSCGLADGTPTAPLPFPVVAPEACRARGITDVLLTMNRWYYPAARRRLAPAAVAVHDLWSS